MALDPTKCEPGEEQHESFWSEIKRKILIQYDYRNKKGELFSCMTFTLEEARKRRDKWAETHGM